MSENGKIIRLSIIWGAVVVLVFALLMAMAIITSAPRGDHGRLTCDTDSSNVYTVTITCHTGPSA